MIVKELVYNAKTGEQQIIEREQTVEEIKSAEKAQKEQRIAELKSNLVSTDYKAIKFAEGLISEKEYAEIKAERQAWRDEINRLEKEIK